MPPMVIAAGVTAAATLGGAALASKSSSKATNKAATIATNNTASNNALTREIYDMNKGNISPFMSNGLQASNALTGMLMGAPGTVPSALGAPQSPWDQFRNSTNYQFRLGEGLRGLNQGYAARGLLESGAAMKGINNYAQNFASNELGNYMNLLAGQQNMGLSGANALAGVGTNMVGNVTANNNSGASALANAALMNGNAQGQMYGNIAGALGNLAGSFGSSYSRTPLQNDVRGMMLSNPGIF